MLPLALNAESTKLLAELTLAVLLFVHEPGGDGGPEMEAVPEPRERHRVLSQERAGRGWNRRSLRRGKFRAGNGGTTDSRRDVAGNTRRQARSRAANAREVP